MARAAFPKGTVVTRLRDEFSALYDDENLRKLYPAQGQPGLAPWRLALVTVLQPGTLVHGVGEGQDFPAQQEFKRRAWRRAWRCGSCDSAPKRPSPPSPAGRTESGHAARGQSGISSAHGRFGQIASPISGQPLPFHAPLLGHKLDVAVT